MRTDDLILVSVDDHVVEPPDIFRRHVPARWREIFACAHDVPPEAHLRVQAAFQENVDSGVSKTVNLPASATPEDVRRVLELALELDVKGVTVYRDRVFVTHRNNLWALDRKTGHPIVTFGDSGRVDLRKGLGRPFESQSVSASTPGVWPMSPILTLCHDPRSRIRGGRPVGPVSAAKELGIARPAATATAPARKSRRCMRDS